LNSSTQLFGSSERKTIDFKNKKYIYYKNSREHGDNDDDCETIALSQKRLKLAACCAETKNKFARKKDHEKYKMNERNEEENTQKNSLNFL
jgi:hypothetical protein